MKTIYLIMQEGLYGDETPLRAYICKEAAENYVKWYSGLGHRYSVSIEEIQLVED